ncbi:MAG TPA: Maf family protein, partial [Polyangiaceae bacterium]|nr:Maf family protein [Polyangiaceae bacterium]
MSFSSLANMSKQNPMVLGSGSPRRREILETLRIPFVVRVPHVDESVHQDEDADSYLERVVLAKLAATRALLDGSDGAADAHEGAIILVADTSVVH